MEHIQHSYVNSIEVKINFVSGTHLLMKPTKAKPIEEYARTVCLYVHLHCCSFFAILFSHSESANSFYDHNLWKNPTHWFTWFTAMFMIHFTYSTKCIYLIGVESNGKLQCTQI